ncbi:hypothetical protein BGW38_010868 [Lunasporangiospora selenospora]|uniref:Uncharacterized protein n=1 Tax=Lunasporangiospora selenospora TaxID=979761 RepID=A0A9P6FX42_9FUNG|nr:hypothetical protein BGW38_010868 [Lunasporangiospora selenospora]
MLRPETSQVILRWLRIIIIFASFATGLTLAGYYGANIKLRQATRFMGPPTVDWQEWVEYVSLGIVFVSYIYSMIGRRFIHKLIRSILLAAITIFWLYCTLSAVKILHETPPSMFKKWGCLKVDKLCLVSKAAVVMQAVCGLFVVIEIPFSFMVNGLDDRLRFWQKK